jgi:NADH dehydrogenase [ubiquinone] 1 alpha subcomplex assembly factor 6
MKHGISSEELIRNGPNAKLSDVVYDIATRANDQLLTARSFKNDLPIDAYPVLISAIPVDSFLKKLEKVDFNIFDPLIYKKQISLPFKIWKSAIFNTF